MLFNVANFIHEIFFIHSFHLLCSLGMCLCLGCGCTCTYELCSKCMECREQMRTSCVLFFQSPNCSLENKSLIELEFNIILAKLDSHYIPAVFLPSIDSSTDAEYSALKQVLGIQALVLCLYIKCFTIEPLPWPLLPFFILFNDVHHKTQ